MATLGTGGETVPILCGVDLDASAHLEHFAGCVHLSVRPFVSTPSSEPTDL